MELKNISDLLLDKKRPKKQRTKSLLEQEMETFKGYDILSGILQGLILGPLLLNIVLYDLFLLIPNIPTANCR